MAQTGRTPRFPWLFFLIAYGWSWAFWGPVAIAENELIELPASMQWMLTDTRPAGWGPLIAAAIVALRGEGFDGLRGLIASMVRVRFPARWYVAALFLIPAIVGGAQLIAWLAGDEIPVSEAFENPISVPIAFVWIFFFGGPLQEEAGWRGTATKSLQGRWGALSASLVTGLFWGGWHLPLFFMPREDVYYNQPIWGLVISTVLLSVLLTWVYNNTRRSLFAAMLMHTSWNWSNYLFTSLRTETGAPAFLLLLAGAVILVTIVSGPKNLSRNA